MPHLSNEIFVVHVFSPVATGGGFGGLSPPNEAPTTPKLKYLTLQISGVFTNFSSQAPLLKTFWRRFCLSLQYCVVRILALWSVTAAERFL